MTPKRNPRCWTLEEGRRSLHGFTIYAVVVGALCLLYAALTTLATET